MRFYYANTDFLYWLFVYLWNLNVVGATQEGWDSAPAPAPAPAVAAPVLEDGAPVVASGWDWGNFVSVIGVEACDGTRLLSASILSDSMSFYESQFYTIVYTVIPFLCIGIFVFVLDFCLFGKTKTITQVQWYLFNLNFCWIEKGKPQLQLQLKPNSFKKKQLSPIKTWA